MKLLDDHIKRLGIFFFYDFQGIVDDYVIYMLSEMKRHLSELLIVCNGSLTDEGRDRFNSLGQVQILVRENKGYDVWAYKEAMEYYGTENLENVDELILFNYTIMGPVNRQSLDHMFEKMNQKDIDFWGISIHHGAPFDEWGILEEHYLPMHIQSHFIAVRNKMLKSSEFKEYWQNRPLIHTYEEAVSYHEAIFTKHFAELGYLWEVFCDTKSLVDKTLYPMFNIPVELISDYGCPFFKRKIFFYDLNEKLQENRNQVAPQLYRYLKNDTLYDTDMIIQNLLRTVPQNEIVDGINLNCIVSESEIKKDQKVAILIDQSYEGYEELDYLELSKFAEVYLWTEESDKEKLKKIFQDQPIQLISGAHTTFVSLFYKYLEIAKDYEFVCFLSNNEQTYIDARNDNKGFQSIIAESVIGNAGYLSRIVELFEENSRMGLAFPPNPVHANFFNYLGKENKDEIAFIQSIFEKSGITVTPEFTTGAIVQFTGCMWCRGSIIRDFLETIKESNWLSVEENKLAVFSSVLSLFAQQKGFYTARLLGESLAVSCLTNEEHMLKSINVYNDTSVNFSELCNMMALKSKNAKCYAYFDYGQGYLNIYKQKITIKRKENGQYYIRVKVPKDIKKLRIQMAERLYCIAHNAVCTNEDFVMHNQGGIHDGEYDVFDNTFPQYVIEGNFSDVTEINVVFDSLSFYYTEEGLDDFIELLSQKNDMIKELLQLKSEMQQQMEALSNERDSLKQFKEEVTNSKVFSLLRKLDGKR